MERWWKSSEAVAERANRFQAGENKRTRRIRRWGKGWKDLATEARINKSEKKEERRRGPRQSARLRVGKENEESLGGSVCSAVQNAASYLLFSTAGVSNGANFRFHSPRFHVLSFDSDGNFWTRRSFPRFARESSPRYFVDFARSSTGPSLCVYGDCLGILGLCRDGRKGW